jgi:hypothetical protein
VQNIVRQPLHGLGQQPLQVLAQGAKNNSLRPAATVPGLTAAQITGNVGGTVKTVRKVGNKFIIIG